MKSKNTWRGLEDDRPNPDLIARSTEPRCEAIAFLDGDDADRCDLVAGHEGRHGYLQHVYWAVTWGKKE